MQELKVAMNPIGLLTVEEEKVRVVKPNSSEHWRGHVKTTLWKYVDRAHFEANQPAEVLEDEGNILVNVGINELWKLVAGGTATPFNAANAHIGVGNGITAESPGQTDLQGASKLRKGMMSGFPVFGSDQKITFQAQYLENEANFDWREWGVFNASAGGIMLNRKVVNSGTKASGAIWIFQVYITLS